MARRVESLTSRDDLTSEDALNAFVQTYRDETRAIEDKAKASLNQLETKLEQARDLKSKIDQNIQNKTDMTRKYKLDFFIFLFFF